MWLGSSSTSGFFGGLLLLPLKHCKSVHMMFLEHKSPTFWAHICSCFLRGVYFFMHNQKGELDLRISTKGLMANLVPATKVSTSRMICGEITG